VVVEANRIVIKDIITVRKDRKVASASSLMSYFNLDALIVIDEDDPAGIVTLTDIEKRVLNKNLDPHLVNVGEIYSEPLLWVRHNTTLPEVAQIMKEEKVKKLPIFGNLSSGPILLGLYVYEPYEIEVEN
jgi:CBS domain-containing protein